MRLLIKKITQNERLVNTLYIIFLLITFVFSILTRELSNLDEIWNFGFGVNVANGLTPYNDFNMIITPFASLLSGFILKIFGKELMVLRAFTVLLATAAVFILYKAIIRLGSGKISAAVYGILSVVLFGSVFTYDYNFLCMLLLLSIIYIQLGKTDVISVGAELAIGVLAGLCVATKQSTGLFICLGIAVLSVICYKKDFYKSWLLRAAGGGAVILGMLIYMLAAGNLASFYDYAVAGLSDFSNKRTYLDFILNGNILERLIGIAFPILMVAFIIHMVKHKENRKQKLTVLVMCLCGAIVIYPICDSAHFLIAAFPFMLMLSQIGKIKASSNEMSFICIAVLVMLVFTKTYMFMPEGDIEPCKLSGYVNIPVDSAVNDSLEEVTGYIASMQKQGKRVIICDTTAQTYMIPCGIYNNVYDLPNRGNFGTKAPIEYAGELVEAENTTVLVLRDTESLNWQFPREMHDCITQSMTKTGEVSVFDIYEGCELNG